MAPVHNRCWISVNASVIPLFDGRDWLSIVTDSYDGGRVELSREPHKRSGVQLYPMEITILPPIDAVIARGSPAVERWLVDNGWQRNWRYCSNFRDHEIVEEYEAVERQMNPLYWTDAYATLGGWHMGWPDDDWHDLIDAKLLVHTYMDSEPWVEAWQLPSGEMKVIRRIT
jgi:hypothetical protein